MLDQNLPTFFLADSTDNVKHNASFYLTRGGGDPEPAYSLRHADPALPNSKNCYAAALFDAFHPDILYGEVLIHPRWTESTNPSESGRTGLLPAPPEPIMPTEFTVQLYNPEQQVLVTREAGSLVGNPHYDFSMPQQTFRAPSSSKLDQSQNDPGANSTTPKINFSWKREGKLGKDFYCYVTGKSTDVTAKKKSKEPNIPVALFKSLREVTIYESNLYRVDMEDPKGLEVVLLLTATVIRDVFYGSIRNVFNISDPVRKEVTVRPGRAASESTAYTMSGANRTSTTHAKPSPAALGGLYAQPGPGPNPNALQPVLSPISSPSSRPPITDPRTQWEIDAETARLKAEADMEARNMRKAEDARRRERERAADEETRRLKKMVQDEETERKRQQTLIDQETERLRKIYGQQQPNPALPPRPVQSQSVPTPYAPFNAPSMGNQYPQYPQPPPPQPQHSYPPLQQQNVFMQDPYPNYSRPNSSFLSPAPQQNMGGPSGDPEQRRRRSFFDLRSRSLSDDGGLNKKTSSVW